MGGQESHTACPTQFRNYDITFGRFYLTICIRQ